MIALLVEDEDPKRQHLLTFCGETFPSLTIEHVSSVRSAIEYLRENSVDLVLLDMSLPTYDLAAKEGGGRPQGAGGIEVIRWAEMMGSEVPILVVTAYPALTIDGQQKTLEQVDKMLQEEHPDIYRGLVYFNSVFGGWRQDLGAKLIELGASQ